MKKILTSLLTLTLVAGLVGAGTMAYFSDTETSSDNTFVAGSIDLEVGNTSTYNGVANAGTTWSIDDITDELFFGFNDVKPGDWGQDTIDLRVTSNPSWVCANITLTLSAENGINEPEEEDGDNTIGDWNGELDNEIQFMFWGDANSDGVFDAGESVLMAGPISDLPQGDLNAGQVFDITDATDNIFGVAGVPFPAYDPADPNGTTMHIGKVWCFGDLSYDASLGGYSCDGSLVNNVSQNDSVTGNVTFYAVQERHNETFECSSWNPND